MKYLIWSFPAKWNICIDVVECIKWHCIMNGNGCYGHIPNRSGGAMCWTHTHTHTLVMLSPSVVRCEISALMWCDFFMGKICCFIGPWHTYKFIRNLWTTGGEGMERAGDVECMNGTRVRHRMTDIKIEQADRPTSRTNGMVSGKCRVVVSLSSLFHTPLSVHRLLFYSVCISTIFVLPIKCRPVNNWNGRAKRKRERRKRKRKRRRRRKKLNGERSQSQWHILRERWVCCVCVFAFGEW